MSGHKFETKADFGDLGEVTLTLEFDHQPQEASTRTEESITVTGGQFWYAGDEIDIDDSDLPNFEMECWEYLERKADKQAAMAEGR